MAAKILGALAGAAFFFFSLAFSFISPPKKRPTRSVEVGEAKEGESAPRRNAKYAKALLSQVEGCDTVPQLIMESVKRYGKKPFLGSRKILRTVKEDREVVVQGKKVTKQWDIPILTPYSYLTFDEVNTRIKNFADGILETGIKPRSLLSIFAETRLEWMVTATACMSKALGIVTVYASLGEDALLYSFNQTEVTHVVTEARFVPKLIQVAKKCPTLSTVIYFDSIPEEKLKTMKEESKLTFYSYDEISELGQKAETKTDAKVSGEDVAIVMYTSGSTGDPKGVVVTHRNFMSVIAGVGSMIKEIPALTDDETYIAYLPLAHILEMACEIYCMSRGYQVGYGTPQTLNEGYDESKKPFGDLLALRPSIMAAVPAILDRLAAGIRAQVAKTGGVKAKAFQGAFNLKRLGWKRHVKAKFLDTLVFGEVQKKFGGKLKLMVSGGAPLSSETQEFLSIVLDVSILQGYGLTETCAGGTLSDWDEREFGRVGPPKACCEIKLRDVAEMNYTSKDKDAKGLPAPRGEILISGGNVTMGYYKNATKTAEDYLTDSDGKRWFATGDIGTWCPDGVLKIIDRKKDLVKLRHGEYIALGDLESKYRFSKYVDNIAIHADPHQDAPVALVVPNENALIAFAKDKGIPIPEDHAALFKEQKIRDEVKKDLLVQAEKNKLKRPEMISDVIIVAKPWTPQDGLLTDAFKLKRKSIYDHHKADLEAVYKKYKAD